MSGNPACAQSFKVSKVLSFTVQGFKVSEFQSENPKNTIVNRNHPTLPPCPFEALPL